MGYSLGMRSNTVLFRSMDYIAKGSDLPLYFSDDSGGNYDYSLQQLDYTSLSIDCNRNVLLQSKMRSGNKLKYFILYRKLEMLYCS